MEKLINMRFLDITDTPSLKAMPLHIGNLVAIEMLSKFIVETEIGSGLKELKNLKNLRGELCISDLHKVREARDAMDADLCTKEGLCRLTMQWCKDFENFRDGELEAKVLGFLRPHQNLESLAISYYGGLEFPLWSGSLSYVNMVHLRLHGCCRARTVPSLGQLSSLKELYIEGLDAICTVGSEFYGTRSPFPSLITLHFKSMLVWEQWSHCVDTEEVGVVFPHLEHLVIQDCPMLIGRLPSQLSSLVKLEIMSCPRTDASPSVISLPSLKELHFSGCNARVLKSIMSISLTALVIKDVTELTCLDRGFTSSMINLEKLELTSCNNLSYLWQDRDVIRNFAHLKRLVVRSCPEFVSFVAGEGDTELPGNLEIMDLRNCVNLENLPSKMHTLSSLGALSISDCPKLVSFPEIGIPTSVKSLLIQDCGMLQSLPTGASTHPYGPSSSSHSRGDMSSRLQELTISGCGSLTASVFSEGRFLPATLQRLTVKRCKGVESLAEIHVDRLRSLQMVEINFCENLRSLPEGLHTLTHLDLLILGGCPALELECFPPLPPSISHLRLEGCLKIKSLPNELYRHTGLQQLEIVECERITGFPVGGLPPQLQGLKIWRCKNMKQPVREWLTPLASLECLYIDGSAGGVGEEEDLVLPLPSSLFHLYIRDMGKVERLASNLPPSLQSLRILDCPKLWELPQNGLSPSLECLWIERCGILIERCTEPTGRYWPLIREIPQVKLLYA